jgi:hypothetical protein
VREQTVHRAALRIGAADDDVGLLLAQERRLVPASVPPVPTEQMKASTVPPVWLKISGPVVR